MEFYFSPQNEGGLNYMVGCLENGNEIGRAIVEVLMGERGEVFLISSSKKQSISGDYNTGGFIQDGGTLELLVLFLQIEAVFNEQKIIMENSLAREGDLALAKLNCCWFARNREIYLELASQNPTISDIYTCVDFALTAQGFSAYLLNKYEDVDFGSSPLSEIAKAVNIVIVGAHDNETFLVWKKTHQATNCQST